MRPKKTMTLRELVEWLQNLTPDCYVSGSTDGKTADLTYISLKEGAFYTATPDFSKWTFDWTYVR